MTLGKFRERKLLVPRLLSRRRDGAIYELTQRLQTTGRICNASAFVEAVLKRELALPTFAGEGLAVAHVRGGAVRELSVAVGLFGKGLPWVRNGQRPAHVVFLCAVPLTEAASYLALLSGLAGLISDEVAFAAVKRATHPEEMLSVLQAAPLLRRSAQRSMPCGA